MMKIITRYFLLLGLLAVATWVVYEGLDRPQLGIDDAHIFFVYAQNIVAGEGIVYNPGGERVEGFTSPLWMAIVTLAFALFPQPEVFLLALSLCITAAALTALWWMVDGGERLTLRGWLFLAWTFSSPSFIIWAGIALMDTALWGSLLMFGTVVVLQSYVNKWHLMLLTVLLLLTRPEAMLWALVFVGIAGLNTILRQSSRAAWCVIRGPVIVYGITLFSMVGMRILYFGYPLPNTYYAKVSPDWLYNFVQGFLYLAAFVKYNWAVIGAGVLPLIAGIVFEWPRLLKMRSQAPIASDSITNARLCYVFLSVIGTALFGAPLLTGGDHFDLARFYQPTWPLFILFAYAMLDTLAIPLPSAYLYLLPLIAVVFFVTPRASWVNGRYNHYMGREFTTAAEGELVGELLNLIFVSRLPSVGVVTAGGIGTTYSGIIIDVLGLNNLAIAHTPGNRYGMKNHAAFNKEVFLQLQPDLFFPVAGSQELLYRVCRELVERSSWHNGVFDGMLDDVRFLRRYALVYVSNIGGQTVLTYIRLDYIAGLQERGLSIALVDNVAGCDLDSTSQIP